MTNLDNSSKPSSPKIFYWLILLAGLGFFDATYLTAKYFNGHITCSLINGCQDVLTSSYSHLGPIPTAAFGVAYYLGIILASLIWLRYQWPLAKLALKILPILGLTFSIWLTYLQIWVIKSLCQYCLLSALISLGLMLLSLNLWDKKQLTKNPTID